MDDDPEPELNQVLLEGHEMSEQVLSPGGLQKRNPESSEDNNIHQEGGDNGPFMEQEPTKKPILGKEAPEQTLQMGGKDSLFKRKELKDQSQPSDMSGNLKGSTTPPRKTSRRSVPRSPGQDSRRGSQQPTSQQAPLSQKSSRSLETEPKDVMWVSKRTGKLMTCQSQQTSLIWERKVLSEIIHPSSEESETSREEEADVTTTEEDMEATASEETTGPEGQQSEEKASRRSSQQRESRRSSQRSINEPLLLIQKGINMEEDTSWISQRTGKEMKNKAQQTSVIWELKTLSEILRSASQDSFSNMETDTTEAEDLGETHVGPVNVQESQLSFQKPGTGQGSRRSSKQLEPKPSRPEVEQGEELAMEPQQNRQMYKADQAQQTESTESLKRELFSYQQQADDSGMDPTASQKGSRRGSQKTDSPQSRLDSRELQSQESLQRDLVSPSLSQEIFGPESKMAAEPQETSGSQGEQLESPQEPLLIQEKRGSICAMKDMWVSKKTGKVVRNQIQQTERSWLQYCAAKMMKVKMCRSQQTDESFLQHYSTRTARSWEALPGRGSSARLCSVCDDGNTTAFEFSDVQLSPVASDSTTAVAYMDMEAEPPSDHGGESAEWQALEEDSMVEWPTSYPDERPGDSAMENMPSYVEGEDLVQQTYSVISLEDGIWMNRTTGKILVTRSQQTSSLTPSVAQSATALRKFDLRTEAGASRPPETESSGATEDSESPELEETQPETPPLSRQGSRSTDDTEKLLSRRLSEAMLLCISYPDLEGESGLMYTLIEEGSWVNVNTGRLLVSQSQQAEGDSGEDLSGDATVHPFPSTQQCGGEGMDDDPGTKVQESL